MKHSRIKIFTVNQNISGVDHQIKFLEDEINKFIQDKVVIETFPFNGTIIVRYKETY